MDKIKKPLTRIIVFSDLLSDPLHRQSVPAGSSKCSAKIAKVFRFDRQNVPGDHFLHLIEKTVKVKKYPDHITVLYNQQIAADHQRMKGKNKTRLDIRHYLGTLNKKPGALRNSTVLKQEPVLEEF